MKTEIEVINHLLHTGGGCNEIPCCICPFSVCPNNNSPLDCTISNISGISRFEYAQNYTAYKIKELLDIL